MELLKFITAGSVDDGKSTLIGRLLYDSGAVSSDVRESIEKYGKSRGNETLDLSLLTDGLRAEREQGITIDVAYKYFSTDKRKFIIADTPGHFQFTKNMITGASHADLAILLVDARKGIVEQTKRHAYIIGLLGIKKLVVAVNKIDLIDYSQERFNIICLEFQKVGNVLGNVDITFIPVSAAAGDNIVHPSSNTPWYSGKSLMNFLEEVEISKLKLKGKERLQVQYVIRPKVEAYHDYRGYAGRVTGGDFKVGDGIRVFPSGYTTTITSIEVHSKCVAKVRDGQPAVFLLQENIDISRGDTICKLDSKIRVGQNLEVRICWMDSKPLQRGSKFILQHYSNRVKVSVTDIAEKIDLETLGIASSCDALYLNDIGKIHLTASEAIAYDDYDSHYENGAFILIDEVTNCTVGAGIIIQ